MPSSPQECANDAWAELGHRMGFDHMTVQPDARGDRFFTALPNEPETLIDVLLDICNPRLRR
jgi:hypothetical protein